MTSSSRFSSSLGLSALAAVVLGTLLGLVGRATDWGGIQAVSNLVSPLGSLWFQALQMTVIPLVVTHLLAALVRPSGAAPLGRLGGRTLILFAILSVIAGLFTWFLMEITLGYFRVPDGLAEILEGLAVPPAFQETIGGGGSTLGEWINNLLPRNPLQAAVEGNILQILLCTILLGLAMGRLPGDQRDPLTKLLRGLAEAMMILVGWVMLGMPLGVFSLMLSLSLGSGLGAVGVVGLYFFAVTGALLLITLLLYPLTWLLGNVSLIQLTKAALPAQIVALTTQSSLASLPALVEGGKDHLDLSDEATGFVLPLCVSVFKMNQAVSPVVKLLFLAHFLGVDLSVADVLFFLAAAITIGIATPGIPRGNPAAQRLPLYLAVGIPIEGYVLVDPVKHVPVYDAAATVLNVSGDMSAATLLTRKDREGKGRYRAESPREA
jgi:Na+/H+-dicarboxylate symporter